MLYTPNHMNGRVYDPKLGRFLSVDPVFQFPTNTQSLNPYTYVLNTPLSMTDPTGLEGEGACTGEDKNACGASSSGTDQKEERKLNKTTSDPRSSHFARSNGRFNQTSFNHETGKIETRNLANGNANWQEVSADEVGAIAGRSSEKPSENIGGEGIAKSKFVTDGNEQIVPSAEVKGPFVEAPGVLPTGGTGSPRGVDKATGEPLMHAGDDKVPLNADGSVCTSCYAISGTEGRILQIRSAKGFSAGSEQNVVIVATPNGNQVIYGHMESTAKGLQEGQTVTVGMRLGIIGNQGVMKNGRDLSGEATEGVHLHVEIRQGLTPFQGRRFGIP
jgi:murein DD-endopeptidase MepM/ murein hydrolase activator NlpD